MYFWMVGIGLVMTREVQGLHHFRRANCARIRPETAEGCCGPPGDRQHSALLAPQASGAARIAPLSDAWHAVDACCACVRE